METLLYIPNILNPSQPPLPKQQTAAKSVRFLGISKKVFPKPNLQNLIYLAAGSVAALVIMVALGAIKPLGTWHSTELGRDLKSRSAAREKNNNEIPVSAVYSDFASVINLNGDLPTIKFPALWADTERYFVQPFIFSGTVKTPEYPYKPIGDEIERSLGTSTHLQLWIISPDKGREGTEDVVFCFIRRDLAQNLIAVLSADERKAYSGSFLLYVPTQMKYLDQYKRHSGVLADTDRRYVYCEILAYAPDEATLRRAIDSRSQSLVK